MSYEAIFQKSIDLRSFYDCFGETMPKRSEGCTTTHVETLLFSRLIQRFIDKPFWEYPLTIIYKDRPDFMMLFKEQCIGIEVTEQWSKNYGKALSMLEESQGLLMASDFSYSENEKKIKGHKIAKLVETRDITGPPVMGNSDDINWIKRTISTIEIKHQKYIKYPSFKSFNKNILLIFDVRPEFVRFEEITDTMLTKFYELGESTIFDTVICIDNQTITFDLKEKRFEIIC